MGVATLTNLLTQMNQNQEVLQGWDAVLNLVEGSLNEFFALQFSQQTGGSNQITIQQIWCEDVDPAPGGGGQYFTNVYEYSFVLGTPLFQFTTGQAMVTTTQQIVSGSYRSGTMVVQKNFDPSTATLTYDDASVDWSGAAIPVATADNPSISGQVSVEQVKGVANVSPTATSLVLNFAKGAYTLNNLAITGLTNTDFNDQLMAWFAQNSIQYRLASVDLGSHTGMPGLTPTAFQFNVLTTGGGNNIVQVLITTDGSTPASTVILVNEPVPVDDNYTCSLMISSRILYNEILIPGFQTPGGAFSLYSIPPGSPGQIYQAAITPEFNFSGSFTFGSCCDETTVTYNIYLGGTFSGSTTSGFVLTQQVNTVGNAPVQINVYVPYPVTLSGTGSSQTLSITPGTPQISVTGSVEGEISSTLQSILTSDFQNGMSGVSCQPIAQFALQNLLFPGNLFQMTQAQAPGDLLIVGTFTPS